MSEPRILGREEFVERMMARRAAQRRGKPKKSGCGRARPLVRDDGVRFRTMAEALAAAGYAKSGCAQARCRIDAGKAWRDGHVYEWAEEAGR